MHTCTYLWVYSPISLKVSLTATSKQAKSIWSVYLYVANISNPVWRVFLVVNFSHFPSLCVLHIIKNLETHLMIVKHQLELELLATNIFLPCWKCISTLSFYFQIDKLNLTKFFNLYYENIDIKGNKIQALPMLHCILTSNIMLVAKNLRKREKTIVKSNLVSIMHVNLEVYITC